MDDDRKYRQPGYQSSGRDRVDKRDGQRPPKSPQGPKTMQDASGPRLPRLVQSVTASRCFSCSIVLPQDTVFTGSCPKCGVSLHCCKQCAHFEPSTLFQCLKPIPARIPYKDQPNQCQLFSPQVTVMKDSPLAPAAAAALDVRNPRDARTAFDNLFKKS